MGDATAWSGRMNAVLLQRLGAELSRVRLRRLSIDLLLGLPLVLLPAALLHRLAGSAAAVIAAVLAAVVLSLVVLRRLRVYDEHWLLRRLDAQRPQLEDSAALALISSAELNPLQQLQQQRVQARLQTLDWPELRAVLPWRRLVLIWAIAVAAAAVLLWGRIPASLRNSGLQGVAAEAAAVDAGIVANLDIQTPDYTGLGTQHLSALDAKLPAGSRVRWALRIDGDPDSVTLAFDDGSRLVLQRDGGQWQGARLVDRSTLYRVVTPAKPDAPLHRLDAMPDRAPEISVHAPDKTLITMTEQQQDWRLDFEARDDYGLGPAELSIEKTEGDGENISVKKQIIALDGSGDRRHREYRKTLDLKALGFAKGEDLIVRLSVADNHQPQPNRSRSASFILRWPAEQAKDSAGMEGIVRQAAPAYFRSERQLIIDTEALIAERDALSAERLASRADALGVDQKILRLRYGQFLGEEFESNAEQAPPGAQVANANPNEEHDEQPSVTDGAAGFGKVGDVAKEYGHVHDKPGAATLLDPETKRILKSALDEMWQAEGQLRLAKLDEALPCEHRALEYIKQVQQATRVYLARSGLDLPQVDTARRLTGDRGGLKDRGDMLQSRADDDLLIEQAWMALQQGETPDWQALNGWIRGHRQRITDALGLLAAADKLQRDPQCQPCREQLLAQLWPLLPVPATGVEPRTAPDAAGSAYLDAVSAVQP